MEHVAPRAVIWESLIWQARLPNMAGTLLDQRAAGKKLALITNSDWVYTQRLMAAAYEPFLPSGTSWRELFDLVIVSACKPVRLPC